MTGRTPSSEREGSRGYWAGLFSWAERKREGESKAGWATHLVGLREKRRQPACDDDFCFLFLKMLIVIVFVYFVVIYLELLK
jgi:hypothetical protein